jgi:DNA adenine methylase
MRSYLKWAGGKSRVLDRICRHLPAAKRCIEPFVGSGVLFANTSYARYLLADVNLDLMHCYRVLQQKPDALLECASKLFLPATNQSEVYYQLRDEFNELTSPRLDAPLELNHYRKVALFIYLNRHGFNGLSRYNRRGLFNVPFGSFVKPYFPRQELLIYSQKLQYADLSNDSFELTMLGAREGDVIYCDPPYLPLSKTANFTAYAAGGFNLVQQQQLADLALQLSQQGITVIVSNHATVETKKLYAKAKIHCFPVRRNISCKGKKRELVQELLAVFVPQP